MWFILFISLMVSAEQSTCDQSLIKESCDYLKSKAAEEYLTLSDGFKWKNPLYQNTQKQNPYSSTNSDVYIDVIENKIERQVEIQRILDEVSKKLKLSDKFKMAFSQDIYMLTTVNPAAMGMMNMSLPIPIGDESAKFRTVTVDEVKEIFSRFPEKQQKKIKDVVNKGYIKSISLTATVMEEIRAQEIGKKKIITDNVQRVERLFELAKESLIRKISQGKASHELSGEQKSLIKRIETVKLNHGNDEKVYNESTCVNSFLNAFYRPLGHSINICPSYYSQPDSQIISVIGHEIGHSLDPCYSSKALVIPTQSNAKDPSGYRMVSSVKSGDTAIAQSMTRSAHPLYVVEKCLISKIKIRQAEDVDVRLAAQLKARYEQLDKNLNYEDRKSLEQNFYSQINEDKLCLGSGLLSPEINEAMSDVYGKIVLNDYLVTHPIKNQHDRIAAIASYFQKICNSNGEKEIESDELQGMINKFHEEHPDTIKRIEKFTLQIPEVAKAFNCKRDPQYICYDEYLGLNKNRSGSERSVQPQRGAN